MSAKPVEWVLIVFYGPEAHRATYGRHVKSTKYTKDYIQLSRKQDFLEVAKRLFSVGETKTRPVTIRYRWPKGETPGAFVFRSSDRPHLKWETSLGAPKAWKMTTTPSEDTAETLPGNPSHVDFDSAELEYKNLASRGAGQPYLVAVKLKGEKKTLHLRTYLSGPGPGFDRADLQKVPHEIRSLALKTSQRSALAWALFDGSGIMPGTGISALLSELESSNAPTKRVRELDLATGRLLRRYLRRPGQGLFFDPSSNHDAWHVLPKLPVSIQSRATKILEILDAYFPAVLQPDAAAEAMETDPHEVAAFMDQIENKDYSVPDSIATTKVRGSAQKAFAKAVKHNYGGRCAVTGISSRQFLVASHIVPWKDDQDIRLDPSNGICLSVLVDRAFEAGVLQISDDFSIFIDWKRVGNDKVLRRELEVFEGKMLRLPADHQPRVAYLRRRRALVTSK